MSPARIAVVGSIVCFAVTGYLVYTSWRPAAPAITGDALGTTYTVRIRLPERATAAPDDTAAKVRQTLGRIDRTFSTWRDDSQIAAFNAHQGTDWFEVSAELAALVARSLQISEQTDGAFDITVGPLVELWGFGRATHDAPPSDAEVESLRALVGYQRLHARLDPPALRKDDPAMRIDLSAIAKGHAVDAIAAAIDSPGIAGYMIEVGGEVRTRGSWRIGIEAPTPDARRLMGRIELTDKALATSGDYRNYIEVNGRRLPHVIDPQTGRPVEHPLASVSVIADTAAEADALATALLVMGPAKARRFAEVHELAVLLVERQAEAEPSDDAGFATWVSAAWPD